MQQHRSPPDLLIHLVTTCAIAFPVLRKGSVLKHLITVIFISYLCCYGLPASQSFAMPHDANIKILRVDETRLRVEITVPSFEATESENKGFRRLSIPGYAYLIEPGKPQLPTKGVLIHIPPDATPAVQIVESSAKTFDGYRIASNPRINIITPESRERTTPFAYQETEPYIDEAIYRADAFYPAKIADIGFTGYLRDAHVAQVQINPIQYNPRRRQIRAYTRIVVDLVFSVQSPVYGAVSAAPGKHASQRSFTASAPFQSVYADVLPNYTPTYNAAPIPAAAPARPQAPAAPTYKLIIDQDGIYQLTFADLKKVGINFAEVDPTTIRLTNKGRDVPIYVSTEDDGRFDPWDYIEFYGQHNRGTYSKFGEYTSENVYLLTWGPDASDRHGKLGARMALEDGRPQTPNTVKGRDVYLATLHFESDLERGQLGFTDDKRDQWFWRKITSGRSMRLSFNLPELRHAGQYRVRIMLHGSALLTHHAAFFVNDVPIGTTEWHAQQSHRFESEPFNSAIFKAESNQLTVELLKSTQNNRPDQIFLNWFEVDYWRSYRTTTDGIAFEVSPPETDLFRPIVTTLKGFSQRGIDLYKPGVSKIANVEISRVERSGGDEGYALTFADTISKPTSYVAMTFDQKRKPKRIILDTPSSLREPSNRADYIIITADEFYDAVLPFAEYRGRRLRTKVVKVQDIYDEFNHGIFSPEAIREFLRYTYFHWQRPAPSYVLLVGDATWDFKSGKNFVPSYYFHSRAWGQAAADSLYVAVNGNDDLPDMFIGRLPTHFEEEAKAVLDKIIRYEQNPLLGEWRRRSLFLAGKSDPKSSLERFEEDSEELIGRFLPPSQEVIRAYADPASPYHGTTEKIVKHWNEGVAFLHFTGHGGGGIWADAKLFTFNDLPLLINQNKPPLVTSFTCFTGYFDDPNVGGLNETLVVLPRGGAIAAMGSTGLGWVKGDFFLEEDFFEAVFTRKAKDIGTAVLAAKVALMADHPASRDLVNLYNLLGDPVLQLAMPRHEMQMTARLISTNRLQIRGSVTGQDGATVGIPPTPRNGTSRSVFGGHGTLRITNASGEEIHPPHDVTVTSGQVSVELSLENPQELAPGAALTVRLYAWNTETKQDLIGGTQLRLAAPDEVDLSVFTDDLAIAAVESGASRRIEISAKVYNIGHQRAENVLVTFYNGEPSETNRIAEMTIPRIEAGQEAVAKTEWQPETDVSTLHVVVATASQTPEADMDNNRSFRRFVLNRFVVTPQRGSSGPMLSIDGNFSATISPSVVSQQVEVGIAQVPLPVLLNQPALSYAPLPNAPEGMAYQIVPLLADQSAPSGFQMQIGVRSEAKAGLTPVPAIHRWNEMNARWEKIRSRELENQGALISTPVTEWGLFSLIINRDQTPPRLTLEIDDSQLRHDGTFASLNPTLVVTVSDENGVGEVELQLDGTPIDNAELEQIGNLNDANEWIVRYPALLEVGQHRLTVQAVDVSGNQTEETLAFRAGGEFQIKALANRPNPIRTDTWFTYILTQEARDVTIKIYSTSGRLIAKLDEATGDQGYNEINWEGLDRDGEEIANGVYFYKIVVNIADDKTVSEVGKLAVLR